MLLTVMWLTACGGASGFPPVVTAFKAQSVLYSRSAVIYIGGNDLRSNMIVDTGGVCTDPSFASGSSTSLLILNCKVTKVGEMPFTLTDASGRVVYQTTLTVPKPQVTLTTSSGTITLELDPTVVPATVDNFLSYVNSGFYNNTLFHRVIPDFVVQGGGFTTGMVQKTGLNAPIALESNKGLSNVRGTVAMARTGDPNSATSQFFINLVDNTVLDYQNANNPGYAVFGTVVQGLSVLDAIAMLPTGSFNNYANVPTNDVTLTSAVQTK